MIDAAENGRNPTANALTTEQMASISLDFIVAGFETVSATLSFASYLLAKNTDVQAKLQAQIDT